MSDESSTVTVTLVKPIKGPDGEITELKFREPTGLDIERCGNPVVVLGIGTDDVRFTYDSKSMTRMLSQLSDNLPVIIGRLSGNDWNSCAMAVTHFFIPVLANVS